MGGDEIQKVLLASLLNAGQAVPVLLPSATIAACDLSPQSGSLESWGQDLQEVGGLLAVGVHGRVGGGQIRLVEEADIVDKYALGFVVLKISDNLVGI